MDPGALARKVPRLQNPHSVGAVDLIGGGVRVLKIKPERLNQVTGAAADFGAAVVHIGRASFGAQGGDHYV